MKKLLQIATLGALAATTPIANACYWLDTPSFVSHSGCGTASTGTFSGSTAYADSSWTAGGVCAGSHQWVTDMSYTIRGVAQGPYNVQSSGTFCIASHVEFNGKNDIEGDDHIWTDCASNYWDSACGCFHYVNANADMVVSGGHTCPG